MEPSSSGRVSGWIDRALTTRRGNLVGGAVLLVVSLVFYLGMQAISGRVPLNAVGTLWLPLVMALVSVPVFGSIVLFSGACWGFPDGLRVGVVVYAVLGILLVGFGIPNGLPSGIVPAGPFWPFFLLSFHGCVFGVGFWPCPV